MSVEEIAALSTSLAQERVLNAVAIRMLKIAQAQERSVLVLLDGAVDTAARAQQPGRGEQVDAYA